MDRSFLLSALDFDPGMPHSCRPIELSFENRRSYCGLYVRRDYENRVVWYCRREYRMYDVEEKDGTGGNDSRLHRILEV